jgi:glc operon protein GlcG
MKRKPMLTRDDVERILRAARIDAERNDWAVAIAVAALPA